MKFRPTLFATVKIRDYEIGLRFDEGQFRGLLTAGRHWLFDPLGKVKVDVHSLREPWLMHEKLDVIVRSGALGDRALVLDLKDHERGLVWIEGRFSHVLPPGLYAYWTGFKQVTVEVADARQVRFAHPELAVISRSAMADRLLEVVTIEPYHQGVLTIDGEYRGTLTPGRYAFWKHVAQVQHVKLDLREWTLDVGGQDLMTADRVTLRVNALATLRVADPRTAVATAEDPRQALYREMQLALRAAIGARELDELLADKDALATAMREGLAPRAAALGLELLAVGVRDVILPGEMKELMNRVTEAKQAAEANLITRREETAAIRSQANTARLLQENPTLMRLRELEVLEKVAANAKLNVLLGERGLAERVTNLL